MLAEAPTAPPLPFSLWKMVGFEGSVNTGNAGFFVVWGWQGARQCE